MPETLNFIASGFDTAVSKPKSEISFAISSGFNFESFAITTVALSLNKFTENEIIESSWILLIAFSTPDTHDAHVMPSTLK